MAASAERDFIGMEQRRREAARLLRSGTSQAEVARRLGVSRQSVSRWAQALEQGGLRGLRRAKRAGRRPIGIERMLRIHFLQHWFNLSDPAVEECLYDSRAMRRFAGIDLGREPVPDEATICKFRHSAGGP